MAPRERETPRDPIRTRGGQCELGGVESSERAHVRVVLGRPHDTDMGGASPWGIHHRAPTRGGNTSGGLVESGSISHCRERKGKDTPTTGR
jgi:hypothetical protein